MENKVEGWSINIIGKWNPFIFSPEWVSINLFEKKEQDEIDVELQIQPVPSYRLISDGIYFYANSDRISISFKDIEKERLEKAMDIARKIVSMLPHTPMSGLGINLRFAVDADFDFFDKYFDDNINIEFSKIGFITEDISKRWTIKNDQYLINTIVTRTTHNFIIDFNFHSDIEKAEDAVIALKESYESKRLMSYKIMNSVFNIEEQRNE